MRCEICDKRRRLVRDHNHRTGYIRGMLCNQCNGRLGTYEADMRRGRPRLRNSRYRRWVATYELAILRHLQKNTGVLYVPIKRKKKLVRTEPSGSLPLSPLAKAVAEARAVWQQIVDKAELDAKPTDPAHGGEK